MKRIKIDRRMGWINKYKIAKACQFCGYNANSAALDFDHIDPTQKLFKVASDNMTRSLRSIMREMRKCRVLCSNCHRIHTFENRFSYLGTKTTAHLG